MTKHLNEIEIFDCVKSKNRTLSKDRQSHLNTCDYCQQTVKEQSELNSILFKMKHLKAPNGIYNFVKGKINPKPSPKRDWFFYIMLGTLAIVATLLFFNFGSNDDKFKPNRQEQVKEFIENKISLENINIEEDTEQLYQKFNGVFKAFGRSTYGSTILFVLCVILFYIFIDQQFLRKKFITK